MSDEIKIPDIDKAVDEGLPVKYIVHYVDDNNTEQILQTAALMLEKKNRDHFKDPVIMILKEFINNANKSNLKRAHFFHHDLSMDDPKNYELGMESFDTAFREHRDMYQEICQKNNYYLKLDFPSARI